MGGVPRDKAYMLLQETVATSHSLFHGRDMVIPGLLPSSQHRICASHHVVVAWRPGNQKSQAPQQGRGPLHSVTDLRAEVMSSLLARCPPPCDSSSPCLISGVGAFPSEPPPPRVRPLLQHAADQRASQSHRPHLAFTCYNDKIQQCVISADGVAPRLGPISPGRNGHLLLSVVLPFPSRKLCVTTEDSMAKIVCFR